MEKSEFAIRSRLQKEWGWYVILDIFFTGTGAGSFVFALILGSLIHMVIGVILVLLGALFLLADLSRPKIAWRAIMRPRTSWISRGALSVMVFIVLSVLYMVILWIRQGGLMNVMGFPWTTGPVWFVSLGVIAGCAALFVVTYPGFLLGSMRSVPIWNTALLPIFYLISGLLCGLGVIYLIPYKWGEQMWGLIFLEKAGLGLIILGIVMLVSPTKVEYSDINPKSVSLFAGESYRMLHKIGILGAGMIFPLIILILELTSLASSSLLPFAGICIILGMFLSRYVIIQTGRHGTPV